MKALGYARIRVASQMKGMVQFFVAFGEGVGYNYEKSKVEAEI